MPIYEFKCSECGKIDELLMKFTDPEPTNCSICGGKTYKLISHSSFSLKGSGWYVTDYAKKSAPSDTVTKEKSDNNATTDVNKPAAATPPSTDTSASVATAAAAKTNTTTAATSAPAN